MAAPAPAPTPAPSPAPTPDPAPAPPPGWKSSEHWLYFLVIVLNGLFSSNLVVQTSELGKAIMLGLSVLAALGYGANRTMLKIAHLKMGQPSNDNAPPAIAARAAQAGHVAPRVMLILAGIAVAFIACATQQKWTNSFVGCEKANFGKLVQTPGGSGQEDILTAVKDVIQKNAADLEIQLASLAVSTSVLTIGCAIQATLEVLSSSSAGSSAGSAGSAVPLSPQMRARAQYPGLDRALAWLAAHSAK
jgi:hypothetical protein